MFIMELTRLLKKLAAAVQAILPESLQVILMSLTPPNKKIFRFGYRYLKVLIVLVFREDHDYCTISAKPRKLGIRLAVKDCLK